jgi:hypothetical protein
MARANLKYLLEDAEMRVQRGQRRLDRQRESVAALSDPILGHVAT